ncbi:MAG: hydroxymethylbilane synthase [Saprospiraceae bacterium]|nr:hydroxymethylbilane synthase [Saprospiraceae bacterium]
MAEKLRIGSRDSALATWQAEEVQRQLAKQKVRSEIVFIKSHGDLNQSQPLHSIGITGLFTKALDDALLNDEIDVAVHSCKDLPSQLHEELELVAYLEREDPRDALVGLHKVDFLTNKQYKGTVATGSVRRKAQLLNHFPDLHVVGLRGNVPTRLDKLKKSDWDGAVFASAGLKRLGIEPEHIAYPSFFVPSPAQGVVAVAARKSDAAIKELLLSINHSLSALAAEQERIFLRLMEGGCISPIGAYGRIEDDIMHFEVAVHSPDGKEEVSFTLSEVVSEAGDIGERAYEMAVAKGAKAIIEKIDRGAEG